MRCYLHSHNYFKAEMRVNERNFSWKNFHLRCFLLCFFNHHAENVWLWLFWTLCYQKMFNYFDKRWMASRRSVWRKGNIGKRLTRLLNVSREWWHCLCCDIRTWNVCLYSHAKELFMADESKGRLSREIENLKGVWTSKKVFVLEFSY